MKVLLDHNLPRQLKPLLLGQDVYTAREMKWDALSNGKLLIAAENEASKIMVTGDQNLTYQQNDLTRAISLVVLTEIDRKLLIGHQGLILAAIERSSVGSYELVRIPNSKNSQR